MLYLILVELEYNTRYKNKSLLAIVLAGVPSTSVFELLLCTFFMTDSQF